MTAILATVPQVEPDPPQHIVLHGMSWEFYEKLLEEIGDGATRVTYDRGNLEIISSLPTHETISGLIAAFLRILTLEMNIPMRSGGSTTFRKRKRRKGLEPDECFWIQHEAQVREIDRLDPPPDLAVEIDITWRSIPRQPIYAALGVPELWRYAGGKLTVLLLQSDGKYHEAERGLAFPFLKMADVERFLAMAGTMDETSLIRAWWEWVKTLPKPKS